MGWQRLCGRGMGSGAVTVFLVLCAASALSFAQVTDTRSGEIEAARVQKLGQIEAPAPPSPVGARLGPALNLLSAGGPGLKLKLGGIVSGAGFLPVGVEYRRPDLVNGELFFKARTQVSPRKFQKHDVQLGLPSLLHRRVFLTAYALRQDYPGIYYYGPGPDSPHGRTGFRLENTGFEGTAGIRPLPHTSVGASLGYLFVNVGRATVRNLTSADTVFSPLQTPGLDRQANFLSQVAFLEFDYRDHPNGPRKGGFYIFEYGRYLDKTLARHSFQRADVHLQQYVPFFNEERRIVLNAKSTLTFPGGGQSVPFYLQPTLGGSEDLRGFPSFRFYGNHMLAASVEYLWSAFPFLDMALFWDTGKVFSRRAELNFANMESSVGFGMRFHFRDSPVLRADVGFSHEGAQIWLRITDIFGDRAAGPIIRSDFVDGRRTDAD